MKHSGKLAFFLLLFAVLMSGCCSHTWKEADCKHPRTCTQCGKTKGETGDHLWEDATCQHPRTCTLCGEEKGVPSNHKWEEATCTERETCRYCGSTRSRARGHQWKGLVCEVCGETREETDATAPTMPVPAEPPEDCFPLSAGDVLENYQRAIADAPMTVTVEAGSGYDGERQYDLKCGGYRILKLTVYTDGYTDFVKAVTLEPYAEKTYPEDVAQVMRYATLKLPFAVSSDLTTKRWNEIIGEPGAVFEGTDGTTTAYSIDGINVTIKTNDRGYVSVTCHKQ